MNKNRSRRSSTFLGVSFDHVSESDTIDLLKQFSRGSSFEYVVTPNVDHVVRLYADTAASLLWASYRKAALRVCDSRVLGCLARVSGIKLTVVPGSDLTARLLTHHADAFPRIAVVGGDEELLRQLRQRYGSCEWLHHIPPMGVRDDRDAQNAVIEFVQQSAANLVLFAIGSPQSELLCAEIRGRGATGAGLCIGASLEFLTRAKKRAPLWMRRVGLEWLFRLLSEPRRLWRRYLVKGPLIFWLWWQWQTNRLHPVEECGSRSSDG
jgi:exopolysaccharide biosynthesis WecB/TagA/CpsF family protein